MEPTAASIPIQATTGNNAAVRWVRRAARTPLLSATTIQVSHHG